LVRPRNKNLITAHHNNIRAENFQPQPKKPYSIILLLMPKSGNENMAQVLIKNIQNNVGKPPAYAFSKRWSKKWKKFGP
jgi:hypothetical protein